MKILNFGSLNIDYTYDVDHFVRGGETLSSASLHTYGGGKGLNQSIAAGRSGAQVWHAGAVGGEGGFLLKLLEDAGVHTGYVARTEEKTGHAVIQRDRSGQNCILLYGGANQTVTPAQAETVLSRFSAGDWLMLQNEISSVGAIMEAAHRIGMRIALNPSPMDEKITAYPLQTVDLLILNEVEAAELCGQEQAEGPALLRVLGEKFPECAVVLTLGASGAWYRCAGEVLFQESFSVPVTDTTGAGDTFTGFLLGALVRGESPARAMREAAAAASIAVTRPGAAASIPTAGEVREFLKERFPG